MMQKKLNFAKAIVLGLAIFSGTQSNADTTSSTFNVYLRGIKAGQLKYAYSESGSNYSASGIIQSTGIVGALAKYKFTANSSGTISNGTYSPRTYSEDSDTGRRQSEKTMSYVNGIPKVQERKLPKPFWADPAKQKGTIDPMTAIAVVLNDKTAETVCKEKLNVFDGARLVQITVSNAKINGSTVSCQGMYKRVDGFSKREIGEGSKFPFTLTYKKTGEKFQVSNFEMSTLRGRAKFVRQ